MSYVTSFIDERYFILKNNREGDRVIINCIIRIVNLLLELQHQRNGVSCRSLKS